MDNKDVRLLEAYTIVTLEAVGAMRTRVSVEATAIGFEEIAKSMIAGMEEGWTQSKERLAEETKHS